MRDTAVPLEALQREVTRLASEAETRNARYARTTWLRFVAVFFPVPFVVVLLRLEFAAWHYYLAGGAYVVFAFGLFALDTAMSAKCDRAAAAAAAARAALEKAKAG